VEDDEEEDEANGVKSKAVGESEFPKGESRSGGGGGGVVGITNGVCGAVNNDGVGGEPVNVDNGVGGGGGSGDSKLGPGDKGGLINSCGDISFLLSSFVRIGVVTSSKFLISTGDGIFVSKTCGEVVDSLGIRVKLPRGVPDGLRFVCFNGLALKLKLLVSGGLGGGGNVPDISESSSLSGSISSSSI